MERQAKEAAERKAALEAKRAAAGQTEDKPAIGGGLKAPSRLARPTASSTAGLSATEERK